MDGGWWFSAGVTGAPNHPSALAQCPLTGGLTPPVGGGVGGGIRLPEVGGVSMGRGGSVGGATKLPDVGGIAAAPPLPLLPPVPATLSTAASSTLAGAPAWLGSGATKLPEVTDSWPQAAT